MSSTCTPYIAAHFGGTKESPLVHVEGDAAFTVPCDEINARARLTVKLPGTPPEPANDTAAATVDAGSRPPASNALVLDAALALYLKPRRDGVTVKLEARSASAVNVMGWFTPRGLQVSVVVRSTG